MKNLLNLLKSFFVEKSNNPRMYVFVRKDLNPIYACVQGGHAVAQYALEHRRYLDEWNNEYLINLSVFNGLALEQVEVDLLDEIKKYDYYSFYEPDLKSELPTAICIFENGDGYVSDFVKDLKLASK